MPKRNTTWGATSILRALQHREGSRDLPFARPGLYLRSCDCVGNVRELHTYISVRSEKQSDRTNHIRSCRAGKYKMLVTSAAQPLQGLQASFAENDKMRNPDSQY